VRRLIIAITTLALSLLSVGVPSVAAASLPMSLVQNGFSDPVFLTNAGDDRLFVVEAGGVIKIIHNDNSVSTFLKIPSLVRHVSEQGLLGLAFHPNYASNGLFYVYYTTSAGDAEVLAEFKRSADDPDVADPTSERILLTIHDPYSNHNGGWMAFKGSYLYLSLGDGGSAGDPQNRAQNTDRWWGKILRINPLDPDGAGPLKYSVPASNPFVGRAGLDEIWSYGLRNPWRCSFDDLNGNLWCGDVGQDKFEEIDRVKTGKGINFGWRKVEGFHYYNWRHHTSGSLCTGSCYTLPIAEYAHGDFGGGYRCAVVGGYVSRRVGADLNGNYIFGDDCSGEVWVLPANFARGTALPNPVVDTDKSISSFGEDNLGRIYLVDLNGGIYRLDGS
jgi:glucose/arabinose dehydrogenase